MKRQLIVISDYDMDRLNVLTRGTRRSVLRDQQQLELLDQMLQSADIRPLRHMPKSVVRLSSKVRVRDIETRKEDLYRVVLPDQTNASIGLISVLAPIGIALIGRRKGASIEAIVPGRIRRLQIREVIQDPSFSPDREIPLRQHTTPTSLVAGEGFAA